MIKNKPGKLNGIKILISAGPTHEKIDPVRFIGNYSTGKMGYAIAEACAEEGASVLLVSGPVNLEVVHPGISRFDVTSANEMAEKCLALFGECQAGIMTAAVADYTPGRKYNSKVKRTKENLTLELVPTLDIAAELGKRKRKDQVLVGFALETDQEEINAQGKLKRKNFDFIVLNSLNDKGAGFGVDTNKITIIDASKEQIGFALKPKEEVASDIFNEIMRRLDA